MDGFGANGTIGSSGRITGDPDGAGRPASENTAPGATGDAGTVGGVGGVAGVAGTGDATTWMGPEYPSRRLSFAIALASASSSYSRFSEPWPRSGTLSVGGVKVERRGPVGTEGVSANPIVPVSSSFAMPK